MSDVVVAACRIDAWTPWLAEATRLLDAREEGRAARMHRSHDASARRLAYALHRLFLAALRGDDPRDVPLQRDARGAPVLGDGRWWTSLSHAGDAIALAVGTAGPVGVDIEHEDRMAGMAAIEGEVLHPTECAELHQATRASRLRVALETWVRKEAYLKATGIGLVDAMSGFALPEGAIRPLAADAGRDPGFQVRTTLLDLLPGHLIGLSAAPTARIHALVLEPRSA